MKPPEDWRRAVLDDGREVIYLDSVFGEVRAGRVEVIITFSIDDGVQTSSVWLRPDGDDGWVGCEPPEVTP